MVRDGESSGSTKGTLVLQGFVAASSSILVFNLVRTGPYVLPLPREFRRERNDIMIRLLMVVTGVDHLTLIDGSIRKTGFWAEEVVIPHELFTAAGLMVEMATPGGAQLRWIREAWPRRRIRGGQGHQSFQELSCLLKELKHPLILERLTRTQVDSYDAIFLVGGMAPCKTWPTLRNSGRFSIACRMITS